MATLLRCLVPLLALWALSAFAEVDVRFLPAGKYVDIGDAVEARDAMREIERHLARLGERYLAPGSHLSIEVLEVDLAGRVEMLDDCLEPVRVMRGGVDWPHLLLRYTLHVGQQVENMGEDSLDDPMYLDHAYGRFGNEPLFYEKQLLDAWFKTRFARNSTKGRS